MNYLPRVKYEQTNIEQDDPGLHYYYFKCEKHSFYLVLFMAYIVQNGSESKRFCVFYSGVWVVELHQRLEQSAPDSSD